MDSKFTIDQEDKEIQLEEGCMALIVMSDHILLTSVNHVDNEKSIIRFSTPGRYDNNEIWLISYNPYTLPHLIDKALDGRDYEELERLHTDLTSWHQIVKDLGYRLRGYNAKDLRT